MHKYDIRVWEENVSNGPVCSVLHRCPELFLDYFDISTVLVPDITHDLHEGVILHLVHTVILKAIQDKNF